MATARESILKVFKVYSESPIYLKLVPRYFLKWEGACCRYRQLKGGGGTIKTHHFAVRECFSGTNEGLVLEIDT